MINRKFWTIKNNVLTVDIKGIHVNETKLLVTLLDQAHNRAEKTLIIRRIPPEPPGTAAAPQTIGEGGGR